MSANKETRYCKKCEKDVTPTSSIPWLLIGVGVILVFYFGLFVNGGFSLGVVGSLLIILVGIQMAPKDRCPMCKTKLETESNK